MVLGVLVLVGVTVGVLSVALYKRTQKLRLGYPFSSWNSIPPLKPLVTDQKIRDSVLKQGFKREKVPKNLDAIVIGSGAGGLTAASLLSRAGWKVLVLEQHDQAGVHYVGKLLGNTHLHCLVDQITDGQMEWVPMDNAYDEVYVGTPGEHKSYPIPTGLEALRKSWVKYFPDEIKGIDAFLNEITNIKLDTIMMFGPKSLPMWLAKFLVTTRLIHLVTPFFRKSRRSAQEVIASFTQNEDLRLCMLYFFNNYGMLPSEGPFTMHAMCWNHFSKGAAYPNGGASEFAFHSIPVIEKSGGKVLMRANVTDILTDNYGKACGVTVQKGTMTYTIRAPVIISAAGVMNTFGNYCRVL